MPFLKVLNSVVNVSFGAGHRMAICSLHFDLSWDASFVRTENGTCLCSKDKYLERSWKSCLSNSHVYMPKNALKSTSYTYSHDQLQVSFYFTPCSV